MPQIIDSRDFPSKTSRATYTAILYDNGDTSCNCKGWTMKRPGQERDCRHTVTLRTGTVIKVTTNAEMARMALRGEQYNVVKRWTNAITGQEMVSLRMMERRETGIGVAAAAFAAEKRRRANMEARERDMIRSPRDRDSAREQFKVSPFEQGLNDGLDRLEKIKPPRVTTLGIPAAKPKPIDPPPARARIAWDEEV